jgi:hypothetical protein
MLNISWHRSLQLQCFWEESGLNEVWLNKIQLILPSLLQGVAVYCRNCKTFCLKLHVCPPGSLQRNHHFATFAVCVKYYSLAASFGSNDNHIQSQLHFQIIQISNTGRLTGQNKSLRQHWMPHSNKIFLHATWAQCHRFLSFSVRHILYCLLPPGTEIEFKFHPTLGCISAFLPVFSCACRRLLMGQIMSGACASINVIETWITDDHEAKVKKIVFS